MHPLDPALFSQTQALYREPLLYLRLSHLLACQGEQFHVNEHLIQCVSSLSCVHIFLSCSLSLDAHPHRTTVCNLLFTCSLSGHLLSLILDNTPISWLLSWL